MNTLDLHEGYDILESVQHDLEGLKGMNADGIKAAYVANILAALLLLRTKDKLSRKILRDTTGWQLRSLKDNMSPLNVWGFIIKNPKNKKLKGLLDRSTEGKLNTAGGRILSSNFKSLHEPVSKHPHTIAWDEVTNATRIIAMRLDQRNPKTTFILETLLDWHKVEIGDRHKAMAYAFYYLMQSDQNSILLARLRHASNEVLTSSSEIKVNEDDGGGDGGGDSGGGAIASATTSTGDIAGLPKRIMRGKLIKRTIRRFKPKSLADKTKKKHKEFDSFF